MLNWLIDRNIAPYSPVFDRSRQHDAFLTRDAFRYNRGTNVYHCPADKPLGYYGSRRASLVRVYRIRVADCVDCELKLLCTVR